MELFGLVEAIITGVLLFAWEVVVHLFWVVMAICAAIFVFAMFRRTAPAATKAASTIDPVEMVREAIRNGEMDAEIARAEQRNQQRRQVLNG